MNNKMLMFEQMAKLMQKYAQGFEDDAEAIEYKWVYPPWKSCVGKTVKQGFKFTYENELYKVIQPELTIEGHRIPNQGTESLYAKIDETHAGTVNDPIPYNGNMELFNGKYYIQNDVIYECIRDSGTPLYHDLASLVGIYVNIYTTE